MKLLIIILLSVLFVSGVCILIYLIYLSICNKNDKLKLKLKIRPIVYTPEDLKVLNCVTWGGWFDKYGEFHYGEGYE